MQKANLLSIAQSLSQQGTAALWLCREWCPPNDPDRVKKIVSRDWVGVWSESTNPVLALEMEIHWREMQRPRQIVRVPNTLDEALGGSFRFSDFAPFMFLDGVEGEVDPLDEITRDDSRIDKIRQLGRINAGVLFIEGAQSCPDAVQIAINAGRRAPTLRRIVILGCDFADCLKAAEQFGDNALGHIAKITVYSGSLVDLLRDISNLSIALEEERIRIGESKVDLAPLLRQEPPITQDYAVLRTSDIDPAMKKGEKPSSLLKNLLSGTKLQWRSIACGFVWDGRPEFREWREMLYKAIHDVKEGKYNVAVLEVDVEAGAGTTVLLSQLAIAAAVEGCPTLFNLAANSGLSYPRLRTFLTDLYRNISGKDASVPAVLIFDTDTSWSDLSGHLDSLSARLNRDNRRVVILRARQTGGFWSEHTQDPREVKGVSHTHSPTALRERLLAQDAIYLAGWMATTYQKINDDDSLPSDWYRRFEGLSRESGCPLLLTMSLLLVEKYREGARLGERLIGRIKRAVDALDANKTSLANNAGGIAGNNPQQFMVGLPQKVSDKELYSLGIVVAALSSLRVAIPRRVVTRLAGIDETEALSVCLLLERVGLMFTREQPPRNSEIEECAYRTKSSLLQLTHHAYGPLLLDALASCRTNAVPLNDLGNAVLEEVKKFGGKTKPESIELLRPILAGLRPGDIDDRSFGEDVVKRFLRVQREKSPASENELISDDERTFRRWQWSERERLLDAFKWLPDGFIRTSASILHSRAITEAKCTRHECPEDARKRYMQAEDDLIAALEVDSESRSDNPVFMLNTLGGVYVFWSQFEREIGDPQNRVEELCELAEEALREAKLKQPDSAYPSYYLAVHKVQEAKHLLTQDSNAHVERAGEYLAEALELLSMEPEPQFQTQWDELVRMAVDLLKEHGQSVINELKKNGKHLGWALEALHELNGEFPRESNPEIGEQELGRAWKLIEESFQKAVGEAPPITHLLRYMVFSVREDRLNDPAYDIRLNYLEPLVETKYYDDPVLQFDYGMLLFQNREFEKGAKVFVELRRGQRFYFVPRDRETVVSQGPNSLTPYEFRMQVQTVDKRTQQGWARIGFPIQIPTPVPFGVRSFEGRGYDIKPRASIPCNITIRPAGPLAEPVILRRSGVADGVA